MGTNRRGNRRTAVLNIDGINANSQTLMQWAQELGIPYKTLHERYRVTVREVRKTLGLGPDDPVDLPLSVRQHILRPARPKPGEGSERRKIYKEQTRQFPQVAASANTPATDPLEGFSDYEVILLRREASRLGIPFRKIRAMLNDPELRDSIKEVVESLT